MTSRRPSWIGLGVVLATVCTACSSSFGMPPGATEQSRATFELWQLFVIVAIPVAAIVYGLIFWTSFRYRRRAGEDPQALGAQFRANRLLEIVYTVIPILIVVGLFVAAMRTGATVDEVVADPDVRVEVQAFSWGWRFVYPEESITIASEPSGEGVPGPEMVLPKGATVRIVLTSHDVIHAFWVPMFLYKHDAIPGRTFEFDLTPTETGVFYGECTEFCGLNHAYMTFSVRVVSPEDYRTWVGSAAGATTP